MDDGHEAKPDPGRIIPTAPIGLALGMGLALEDLRTERHLSIAELSRLTRIPQSDLEDIESGLGPLKAQDLAKLATALRVQPSLFFKYIAT